MANDYSNIDPLEFLRVMQDHRQQQAQQAPPQPAPQPMQNPTSMGRIGGQGAGMLGPAHQALMAALSGGGQNPQAQIAAMTANPALAQQVNGAVPQFTPQGIPQSKRIDWGQAANAGNAMMVDPSQIGPNGQRISWPGQGGPPPAAQPQAPAQKPRGMSLDSNGNMIDNGNGVFF